MLASVHEGKRLCVKPFASLSLPEVHQQLAARYLDSVGSSEVDRQCLADHLGGLQSVSLLLVTILKVV